MTQSTTSCELDEEDSPDGTSSTEGTATATLFEEGRTVRVSEIVGDLPAGAAPAASPTLRSRRGLGGLRLDWYDWGVVALIVASLAAALLCLLNKG